MPSCNFDPNCEDDYIYELQKYEVAMKDELRRLERANLWARPSGSFAVIEYEKETKGYFGKAFEPPVRCPCRLTHDEWAPRWMHSFFGSCDVAKPSRCAVGAKNSIHCVNKLVGHTFSSLGADFVHWPLGSCCSKTLASYRVRVVLDSVARDSTQISAAKRNVLNASGGARFGPMLYMPLEPACLDSAPANYQVGDVLLSKKYAEVTCPVLLDVFGVPRERRQPWANNTLLMWFKYDFDAVAGKVWKCHRPQNDAVDRVLVSVDSKKPKLFVENLSASSEIATRIDLLRGTKTYFEYLQQVASAKYAIVTPKQSSTGQSILDAAAFGLPTFCPVDKFFCRLLMPPYMRFLNLSEIGAKIERLEKDPALYSFMSERILRRTEFADVSIQETVEHLVDRIARMGFGSHPRCPSVSFPS